LNSTLLVIVVVVVIALVLIGLIAAIAGRRGTRLRSLPDESRGRFARSWRAVETRFIDDPHGAVQEADRIAVMILGERGATIHDDKMPEDLRKARAAASSDEGRQGTEGMRKAMVHYKRIVDDAVGREMEKRPEDTRREVAS
jgi:hypothetical protein